ncbi:MAG: hypothetical protein MJE68_01030 [Proteobacteria bacterium]|nr:hypothetical protein [Pseudomonadota bacterium]
MKTLFGGMKGPSDVLTMSAAGNNLRVQFEEKSLLVLLLLLLTWSKNIIANGVNKDIDWSQLKFYVKVREQLGKRTNNFLSQDA